MCDNAKYDSMYNSDWQVVVGYVYTYIISIKYQIQNAPKDECECDLRVTGYELLYLNEWLSRANEQEKIISDIGSACCWSISLLECPYKRRVHARARKTGNGKQQMSVQDR